MLPKCQECKQVKKLCVCNVIDHIDTDTRVIVFMHYREFNKSSNTGRLVKCSLNNSEVHLVGLKDKPLDISDLDNDKYRKIFLFPRKNAKVITPEILEIDKRPVMLIIPDGNWNQASHMYTRIACRNNIECVKLPPGPPVEYKIRDNIFPERLSTFEAITRAMGIIEGKHVEDELDILFKTMVTRFLFVRGRVKRSDVFGDIPEWKVLNQG